MNKIALLCSILACVVFVTGCDKDDDDAVVSETDVTMELVTGEDGMADWILTGAEYNADDGVIFRMGLPVNIVVASPGKEFPVGDFKNYVDSCEFEINIVSEGGAVETFPATIVTEDDSLMTRGTVPLLTGTMIQCIIIFPIYAGDVYDLLYAYDCTVEMKGVANNGGAIYQSHATDDVEPGKTVGWFGSAVGTTHWQPLASGAEGGLIITYKGFKGKVHSYNDVTAEDAGFVTTIKNFQTGDGRIAIFYKQALGNGEKQNNMCFPEIEGERCCAYLKRYEPSELNTNGKLMDADDSEMGFETLVVEDNEKTGRVEVPLDTFAEVLAGLRVIVMEDGVVTDEAVIVHKKCF